jgi:hypothetical protein
MYIIQIYAIHFAICRCRRRDDCLVTPSAREGKFRLMLTAGTKRRSAPRRQAGRQISFVGCQRKQDGFTVAGQRPAHGARLEAGFSRKVFRAASKAGCVPPPVANGFTDPGLLAKAVRTVRLTSTALSSTSVASQFQALWAVPRPAAQLRQKRLAIKEFRPVVRQGAQKTVQQRRQHLVHLVDCRQPYRPRRTAGQYWTRTVASQVSLSVMLEGRKRITAGLKRAVEGEVGNAAEV